MEFSDFSGVFRMKDMVDYETETIKRVDVEANDKFKYFLMAFDADKMLAEHKAPGNAILTVLEGRVAISYHGNTYDLGVGDNFAFPKGELHSVYAPERAKVSLMVDLS